MMEQSESGPTAPITTASFLDCAERYIAAACILIERRTPVDSIGMLASHGLELALKAYLLHSGVSVSALKRRDVRHNLAQLWLDAAARGLDIEKPPPWWLRVLAFYHDAPYLYRYPTEGQATAIPDGDTLPWELRGVLTAVAAATGLNLMGY
jgi:hypothetical protein